MAEMILVCGLSANFIVSGIAKRVCYFNKILINERN